MITAQTGAEPIATLPAHIAQPPESFAQPEVKLARIKATKNVTIGRPMPPMSAPRKAVPMIETMPRRGGGVGSSADGVLIVCAA